MDVFYCAHCNLLPVFIGLYDDGCDGGGGGGGDDGCDLEGLAPTPNIVSLLEKRHLKSHVPLGVNLVCNFEKEGQESMSDYE